MSAPEPAARDANLANLILALLAPMFLWSTSGDIRLAYAAAAQTVNEYRIANRLSLFTVAKIIAFDIATLSSLSQSMYEDVSMLLALRLRGNATSLDRAGDRNRQRWEQERRAGADDETEADVDAMVAEAERMVREAKARIQAATQAPEPQQPSAEPAPAATPPAPAPVPPRAPAAERPDPAGQPRAARADAMPPPARALTAEPGHLPQDERWRDMALTRPAAEPAPAAAPPPIPAMAAA
jgi:hypothetical protein